jgi:PAS domain S-box-containing protein
MGLMGLTTLAPRHGQLEHRMTQQDVPPQKNDTRFIQLERELRANEDRWGAVFANPFMGISVLDKNHYFIMTNSTYQAMVGYTDDELKKLTPLDITPASEREINRKLFSELQQGQRQHFELVKRLQRKDGKLIWIQLYVFRIADRAATGQQLFFELECGIKNTRRALTARHSHLTLPPRRRGRIF